VTSDLSAGVEAPGPATGAGAPGAVWNLVAAGAVLGFTLNVIAAKVALRDVPVGLFTSARFLMVVSLIGGTVLLPLGVVDLVRDHIEITWEVIGFVRVQHADRHRHGRSGLLRGPSTTGTESAGELSVPPTVRRGGSRVAAAR
jgi:hypothetical protein